ncbi:MAG: hypothetical protein FI682_05695 [SAR202 cluster bacterium]|nr:hypothetical protein [SAR202 cluster bacterium]RZP18413.1 MAG: hypothetical protein EVA33_00445 [Chloroflexota bacterium]|tara:strand:+ start:4150 stop:4809 length:660 start_codon:yes stop_codon:yes gene_type:complete
MNLIILNKNIKLFKNNKSCLTYYLDNKDDFSKLKKIINEEKPKNIISLDFAIQTSENTSNDEIIVAKETIIINSKPVNWGIPRVDRWAETSHDLNKSICDILESNNINHRIGSGVQLEYNDKISKRKNAKNWIYENIKANFIDPNSNSISSLIDGEIINFSIIRIINRKFSIEKINNNENLIKKIIRLFKLQYFHKITSRKIKNELKEKNILYKFSQIK